MDQNCDRLTREIKSFLRASRKMCLMSNNDVVFQNPTQVVLCNKSSLSEINVETDYIYGLIPPVKFCFKLFFDSHNFCKGYKY